jgi:zinc and cadmium transporter
MIKTDFSPMLLTAILIFSLLGSVGALAGAGVLLLFPGLRERFRTGLVSYAVGTLLGATFIALLPHASETIPPAAVFQATLAGLVLFFILEKILRLPHFHAHASGHKSPDAGHGDIRPAAPLILIGDALHNFVDGVIITTAFLVSVPFGVMTAFAVIAHEVPQELGDFVILLESGMRLQKAYWLNFLAALTTVAGALATYWFREAVESYVPYILAFSAASFLHIATIDLAPVLHHYTTLKEGAKQTAGVIAGVSTIVMLHHVLRH